MRLTRVLVPAPLKAGTTIDLPTQTARHLLRVLRMNEGDALAVFDGAGQEYSATLTAVRKDTAQALLGAALTSERESPLDVTLLQGIARGEKMDLILQKATELGVTRVMPFTAARSTVKLNPQTAAARHEHWQGVITSACEQSGRNRLPTLLPPTSLEQALRACAGDLRLLLLPAEDAATLPALLGSTVPGPLTLLVGPEGGFDDSEILLARSEGFRPCRLGPRVLRTETAALTALAALQTLAGDFR